MAKGGLGSSKRSSLIETEAQHFGNFFVHLVFDTLKNLSLIGALSLIFFAAEWLKSKGMDAENVNSIELLHYWITYGTLIWIGVVFIAKLVKRTFE